MCKFSSHAYLEGALDGFILAHVQGLDELLDLILPAPVLSLAPGKLLTLLSEVGVLVQRLLVDMTAQCGFDTNITPKP